MSEVGRLSILDHLRELRRRLIRSIIAVVITTTVCFFFVDEIVNILKAPAGDIELYMIQMTEGFSSYMRVSLTGGIVLAMPYLMYQFLMFVIPALTRSERKAVYLVLPLITIMFVGGVLFGYYILIPPAANILLTTFGEEIAQPQVRISDYLSFITRLLVGVGIIFELPVVTSFLTRIGVISAKWLADRRRIMIIFAFVMAAIITPTPDILNQTLVAVPIIVLYEISILLAKIIQRRREKAAAATDWPEDIP